ncbi:DNA-binding response regulator, OmpR family, contains REC and winged-helix (wHTH) domain [Anaerocolumna jejuensis DSM 15929]|uniref:Stage 0 sporulation protein A homolog n=1 Tax=Anaerocolumna jejuensis DSM 15929 TaxID=1121322 RepID=A0A1M6SXV5_9FIRM|nr:response regulator transcription factor [Anaerocolumna jejuensis]SHK49562.1 DNA-binding response regulator, OmpR family, contains REC and winged-helix (wHTH) domain [Anaerocolumna jejuensis DSM 15929]
MLQDKTILLVDDEPKIRILLRDFLEKEGYKIMEASDGRQALELFHSRIQEIDMLLLDVMIPEYDGWTVCREIRKVSQVPIIMLTARAEDFDEVHGFEIGADDYIKKPVKPTVLVARLKAFFRRQDKGSLREKPLEFGELMIDTGCHQVKVGMEEISLSPTEYSILITLVQNSRQIVSREQLIRQVWGYDYYGGLRTVDTHINRLRIKLKTKGDAITTIRGFGYKFEG